MNISKTLIIASCLAIASSVRASDFKAEEGDWSLEVNESTGKLRISHKGTAVFNNAYASVVYNYPLRSDSKTITSLNYGKMPEISMQEVSDCFGEGKTYTLGYEESGVRLLHKFSFYPSLPYILVQVSVCDNAGRELQSNSMKALAVGDTSTPLTGASNRMVWVPFDNDGHLKYEIYQLKNSTECTSHEVGYVFDGESRRGIVAGSVDHDTWKSGVTIAGSLGYKLEKFECLSGLTNTFTRDVLPHGKVAGKEVASARFFVGVYDDWREGLNDFGEANTKVVPGLTWENGNPMGWSSWGVQQEFVNYDGVEESARFVKSLYDYGFHDRNGQTVISLDAFATDNIPAANLYKLGTKVFGEGEYRDGRETKEGTNQILGEYCGPLVAWSWSLDSKVPGTGLNGTPDYTYRDIALRVNGKPYVVTSNSGCAVDPTHPGVKANIEFFMKQFATNGTKYIKADFLNNGIIEGDSWYDPDVTTGVQAYNYGMRLLRDEAEKYGMYIVESISPIFPYQYAHGRRTCCDRFSEIGESEYVMNAMSYGWWTDKLYTVNDPDQLVLCKGGNNAKETEGENRVRATTGMATGAFIFGDNFSDKVVYTNNNNGHTSGSVVGYPEESRKRAMQVMCNRDINEYVRNNTGSFMPVDGHKPTSSQSSESIFMRQTADAVYVAVFNFGRVYVSTGSVKFDRLGINEDDVKGITELWSGEEVAPVDGGIDYSVPAKDVKVFKINTGDTGVDAVTHETECALPVVKKIGAHTFRITADVEIGAYNVYDLSGENVNQGTPGSNNLTIDLGNSCGGIYLLYVMYADGRKGIAKIVNN